MPTWMSGRGPTSSPTAAADRNTVSTAASAFTSGPTLTATFTQTSNPANTLTLTGTCTTDFAKDYVAITVTNGTLNDVKIVTRPANALVYDSFDGDTLDAGKGQAAN